MIIRVILIIFSIALTTISRSQEYSKLRPDEILLEIEPPVDTYRVHIVLSFGSLNSSCPNFESCDMLDSIVRVLTIRRGWHVEILVYTDNRGSNENNLKYSQDVCNKIKDYLLEKNIEEAMISTKFFGENSPYKIEKDTLINNTLVVRGTVLSETFMGSINDIDLREKLHEQNRRVIVRFYR